MIIEITTAEAITEERKYARFIERRRFSGKNFKIITNMINTKIFSLSTLLIL